VNIGNIAVDFMLPFLCSKLFLPVVINCDEGYIVLITHLYIYLQCVILHMYFTVSKTKQKSEKTKDDCR